MRVAVAAGVGCKDTAGAAGAVVVAVDSKGDAVGADVEEDTS